MKKLIKTIGIVIVIPALFVIINMLIREGYVFLLIYLNNESIETIKQNIINQIPILIGISDLIFIFLLYLIFLPTKKRLFNRFSIKKIGIKEIVCSVLFGVGLSVLTNYIVGVLIRIIPSYNQVSNVLNQSNASIFKMIILVIFVPICEEILFRGVIFGFLKKNYNLIISIFIQAIIFSMMHFNIIQGIYTFILGVVLAIVYVYSESILTCMILHMVYNLFGTVVIGKLLNVNPNLGIILIIVAIVCLIVGTLQIVNKYSDKLYE